MFAIDNDQVGTRNGEGLYYSCNKRIFQWRETIASQPAVALALQDRLDRIQVDDTCINAGLLILVCVKHLFPVALNHMYSSGRAP
jgi:hypothetical protein